MEEVNNTQEENEKLSPADYNMDAGIGVVNYKKSSNTWELKHDKIDKREESKEVAEEIAKEKGVPVRYRTEHMRVNIEDIGIADTANAYVFPNGEVAEQYLFEYFY